MSSAAATAETRSYRLTYVSSSTYSLVVEPANQCFNYLQSSSKIVVKQAFGRLKNQFFLLLHSHNSSPTRTQNNTSACMIIHNLLNCQGILYLQCWDARNNQEQVYRELPADYPDRSSHGGNSYTPAAVSMNTKKRFNPGLPLMLLDYLPSN
ncbi:hypothetical protein VP01_5763g1 [Puccinia sorghi]|uniref:DDE Tnp4 domain-containing protein n=1 Tax=Puccinia sorghi TaxID=27349 RepID=A0A0L6UKG9_9BASI|nr:hypothetical protein VP01_5763g1 [Puccinia sorghi]